MKPMITASAGIFETQDKFYLQLIAADTDNFYYCEIREKDARFFANEEELKIEKVFELPEGKFLKTPSKKHRKKSKNRKYTNTKRCFEKFLATKRVYTLAEYMRIMDIDEIDKESFEGVEAVLLYGDKIQIFQIKEGDSWVDSVQATSCRYAYFPYPGGEDIFEKNNLEEVEREMFNDVLENHNDRKRITNKC